MNCFVKKRLFQFRCPRHARDLMKRPVCMNSNIHSVLFAPDALDFWVANADSQNAVAHTHFTHYNLGELLPPAKKSQPGKFALRKINHCINLPKEIYVYFTSRHRPGRQRGEAPGQATGVHAEQTGGKQNQYDRTFSAYLNVRRHYTSNTSCNNTTSLFQYCPVGL